MTGPSFASLIAANPLVRVGWGGTRRCCFKIGETGLCVKFYKPRDLYEKEHVKPSIRRDIDRRRFSERLNSGCQEVAAYERYRRLLPPEIFSHFPGRCEKVFHPDYGWGVLETYYTNPDGTAIIPYEFEIARQTLRNRETIYHQARRLLEALAKAGAPFYEPGNFHSLIRPDGSIETKIVDFEPTSKTFFRPEAFIPAFRRIKLRRKAARYLAHIRARYGVTREAAAGEVVGEEFAAFTRLGGNSSTNFHAVAKSGAEYFIKFAPRGVGEMTARLYASLKPAGIIPPLVKFEQRAEAVLVFRWAKGGVVEPWRYSRAQIAALCKAHAQLMATLGDVPGELAYPAWKGADAHAARLAPIHGDFHCRNFHFDGDRVVACFDFERLRTGLPTEDLLRVFVHAYERTRFWHFKRIAALKRNLRLCIELSGYDSSLWAAAIDAYLRHKEERRAAKAKCPAFAAIARPFRRLSCRWLRG